jgi:DNA-binding HxlR family transcriptional regulator
VALPNDYAGQACSLASSLEIVGERWTLLIVRDAFFGVRRFADFTGHLRIPRAVLASRLKTLVGAGVMARVAGERHLEYELTGKGAALWPVVLSLMSWGDDFCAPGGPRRLFRHAADGGGIDRWGRCEACGAPVPAPDTVIAPGPGLEPPAGGDSWVTAALARPHRLLEPLRAADTVAAGDDQGQLAAQAGGDHRLADEDVGRGD